MGKAKFFLVCLMAYFMGIYLCSLFQGNFLIFCLISFALFVLIFLNFGIGRVVLLIGFLTFGFLRFLYAFGDAEKLDLYLGNAQFRACVIEEPQAYMDKARYFVEVVEMYYKRSWIEIDGIVFVTTQLYPLYAYGDCLFISGKLQKPAIFSDFNYAHYLARYDVYHVIYQPKLNKIGENKVDIYSFFLDLKNTLQSRLNSVFAEPDSSLIAGLILGSRNGISDELNEKFKKTGLSHIVAISGYNITILIIFLGGICRFMGRKLRVVFLIFCIGLFVVFVGASASVVRAALMGGVGLLAVFLGRKYYATIALFLSAFFMTVFNPKILLYDIGFQLSFLATAGLIYISPLIENYFKFLPKFFAIRDSVAMTFSAYSFTLPLMLGYFKSVSLISPVANILVLPFIPFAMFLAFLTVVFSFFSNFLALLFGFMTHVVIGIIVFLIEFLSDFSFSFLIFDEVNFWFIFVYCFLLLLFLMNKKIDLI